MSTASPAFKRILLKLSGEALMGDDQFGINRATIERIVREVAEVTHLGVEVAVVIGGGNIFRGVAGGSVGMDRATADYMGMLATVINALALKDAFEAAGLEARVHTAIEMREIAEPYIRQRAIKQLENGDIVIFGAGTGNPFFSTDTTAALRAAEIEADIILLAKKVDAVYSEDPEINPAAKKYDEITHKEILELNLGVMDSTAASLCMDNNIPVHVFGIAEEGNMIKAVCGEKIGTLIK